MSIAKEQTEHTLIVALGRHPTLTLTTALQDSHVYIFRRAVFDLMMTKDPKDLESIREDLVPWLVKGGWQDSLQTRWHQGKSR